MNYNKLFKNIESLATIKGISVNRCLQDSGAGKNFISNIKGGSDPSVPKLKLLADFFGVTTSFLLGEEQENVPAAESDRVKYVDKEFDSLSPENQKKLLDYAQLLLKSQEDE